MHRRTATVAVVLALAPALGACGGGGGGDDANLDNRVDTLLQRVSDLEDEVFELRRALEEQESGETSDGETTTTEGG